MTMTPEQVIQKIAEIATNVGWQAGVGGVEVAGTIVSALAAHPEKIPAFLSGALSVVDDDVFLRPAMGCLTWHDMNGKVVSPGEARAALKQRDH